VTARSWTEYLRTLTSSFGGTYPYWIDKVVVKGDTFNPLAAVVVFVCTVIVLIGVKESMRVNLAITAVP
jgi:amino acid transporter